MSILPDAPKREDFPSEVHYLEALGMWQCRVGNVATRHMGKVGMVFHPPGRSGPRFHLRMCLRKAGHSSRFRRC